MKMGKDEEKFGGPMFPRLHVNDKEKGGPRAPPRNKMALYEQLSIPSQRHSNGTPNNTANLEPPSPLSQGSGHTRGVYFPLHTPTLTHPTEKPRRHNSSDINASLVLLEQKRLDEEDFRVPIFVASNLLAGKRSVGLLKQTTESINLEHLDGPTSSLNSLENTDAIVWSNYMEGSRPVNIACDEVVLNEPIRGIRNGNPLVSRRSYNPEESITTIVGKTCGLLQIGPMEICNDDSEASVVDQVLSSDMTPDVIVGVIGQKHFWKARREILQQQRLFAGQVFELHRLIKVQKLIAGSPNILLEATAYLGKPLKGGSPAVVKLLPLDYVVKPPPPRIFKHKVSAEKPNCNMEFQAENAIEKAATSSVENFSPPPNYRSYSRNPLPTPVMTDNQTPPWYFHQQPQPGNPWLYPVMSPSEGLIYKPCYPPTGGPIGNYFPPSHQYPGMGFPSVGPAYFPPYGMPMMSAATSGSAAERMNNFSTQQQQQQHSSNSPKLVQAPKASDLRDSTRSGTGNTQQHSSNSPKLVQAPKASNLRDSTRSGTGNTQQHSSNSLKSVQAPKASNLRDSSRSGTGNTQQHSSNSPSLVQAPKASNEQSSTRSGTGNATERRNLPSPDTDQPAQVIRVVPRNAGSVTQLVPTRVIRVVPRNAGSATESAARIFRKIQQERKQLDYSH